MDNETTDALTFARALAPCYGGEVITPEGHAWPTIALHAERIHLFIRKSWNVRGKMTVTAYPDDGGRLYDAVSGNVNPDRPIDSIAADIRRRVIEPAKPVLRDYYTNAATREAQETEMRQRKRELAEALGQEPSKHWGRHFHTRSLDIEHDYHLRPDRGDYVTAEIRVYNWAAFLQIARILRADFEIRFPAETTDKAA